MILIHEGCALKILIVYHRNPRGCCALRSYAYLIVIHEGCALRSYACPAVIYEDRALRSYACPAVIHEDRALKILIVYHRNP